MVLLAASRSVDRFDLICATAAHRSVCSPLYAATGEQFCIGSVSVFYSSLFNSEGGGFSISFKSGLFASIRNDKSKPFKHLIAWAWVQRAEWLE